MKNYSKRVLATAIAALFISALPAGAALADETCNSPYMSR